jgi:hypothetical protein
MNALIVVVGGPPIFAQVEIEFRKFTLQCLRIRADCIQDKKIHQQSCLLIV